MAKVEIKVAKEKNPDWVAWGKLLTGFRESRYWLQVGLAAEIGKLLPLDEPSNVLVSNWEAGRNKPSPQYLKALLDLGFTHPHPGRPDRAFSLDAPPPPLPPQPGPSRWVDLGDISPASSFFPQSKSKAEEEFADFRNGLLAVTGELKWKTTEQIQWARRALGYMQGHLEAYDGAFRSNLRSAMFSSLANLHEFILNLQTEVPVSVAVASGQLAGFVSRQDLAEKFASKFKQAEVLSILDADFASVVTQIDCCQEVTEECSQLAADLEVIAAQWSAEGLASPWLVDPHELLESWDSHQLSTALGSAMRNLSPCQEFETLLKTNLPRSRRLEYDYLLTEPDQFILRHDLRREEGWTNAKAQSSPDNTMVLIPEMF